MGPQKDKNEQIFEVAFVGSAQWEQKPPFFFVVCVFFMATYGNECHFCR